MTLALTLALTHPAIILEIILFTAAAALVATLLGAAALASYVRKRDPQP